MNFYFEIQMTFRAVDLSVKATCRKALSAVITTRQRIVGVLRINWMEHQAKERTLLSLSKGQLLNSDQIDHFNDRVFS